MLREPLSRNESVIARVSSPRSRLTHPLAVARHAAGGGDDGGNDGLVHFFMTRTLVPTCEEVLAATGAAARKVRRRPRMIGVDSKSCVDAVSSVLVHAEIQAGYYPPPSEEEAAAAAMGGMQAMGEPPLAVGARGRAGQGARQR